MIDHPTRQLAEEDDAILVVGARLIDDEATLDDLRRHYAHLRVRTCPGILSAIAEVHDRPVRLVLAEVDPATRRLGEAVSALREATGDTARIVLCCTPEREPLAREVARHGADDYVLHPIRPAELDAALGYARTGGSVPDEEPAPAASLEELSLLADVLTKITGKPMALIEQLARLIQTAMTARGATVIIQGSVATSGDVVTKPALTAPLIVDGHTVGQLTVADRDDRPYSVCDAEKLKRYSVIASHILGASSKHREWRQSALMDECSGLPNRRYLYEQLDSILDRARREHFAVTVLLFDVDDFKIFNDTFGHLAGDEIIRHMGRLFQRHCREQDVVTRFGGDEFAVVFWDAEGPRTPGSKHPDSALAVLDRVKQSLASEAFPALGPSGADEKPVFSGQLTISGGLATCPWDAKTRDELIRKADEALLAAKRAGKNRIYPIGEHDEA